MITRKFIEQAAKEAGWNVKIKEQKNCVHWYICFNTDTHLGQDAFFEFELNYLDEIIDRVQETYENYDPDEEATLWYGKNGCPYTLSQLIDDMKEVDESLYNLTLTLNGHHLPDPINEPDFTGKAANLRSECLMHLTSISHRARPSKFSGAIGFDNPLTCSKYTEIDFVDIKWQLVDENGLLYDINCMPLEEFCAMVDEITKNTKP